MSQAVEDAIAERERQQSGEGFSPEMDDQYKNMELPMAAVSYINPYLAHTFWPFKQSWFKLDTVNPRRNYIKAIALLLAEVERLDRLEK